VLIRRYEPTDRDAVRRILSEAFRRSEAPDVVPVEVALLERLIDDGDAVPALSLIAAQDGDTVGHVVCSRASVGSHAAVGLGPIGVLPEHQGRGVGTALMHTVLGAADGIGIPLVALLGSPAYYARFGFVPGTTMGVESPDSDWGDHFQVRALSAYDSSIVGPFRYAPAFDSV
jgi:putative acetyltransferase